MSAEKKLVASCSFGKDSLAAIITAEEHGIHIDEAVYCRIMFDSKISAEFPEHEDFIHNKAIPLLWNRYGIHTTIVQAEKSYCDQFFETYKKGTKAGQIYGFPVLRGPWCNSRLKVRPIEKWQKTAGEYTAVVGIAADEVKRKDRETVSGKLLPLVQYGITEAEAFEICTRGGCLSPAYNNGRTRLGCWFCHNQRISELRRLRNEHPELWARLMELDAVSPRTFKPDRTLAYFDQRFACECQQLTLFDYMKGATL